MTRAQFLNDLYHHLYGMTREQAEQHLTYYAEMLADRMEEGMTEEEAVAGMEDVETIARRILEEEGLPYTPPEERPPVPPEYPDASKLGGGGGKRAYQAPRRKTGRRVAQIALWALAVVIALGAVSRWLWMRNIRHYENTTAIDAPIPVDEVSPQAPYAEEYDFLEALNEAGYAGYEYSSGENHVGIDDVNALDIQWASGTVYIQSWSGDDIQVAEYGHSELSERTAMDFRLDNGVLTIRYRAGTSLGSVKGSKWLTVLVPDGILGDVRIETTSADVQLNSLEVENLTVSTASGSVMPTECYAKTADLSSISGGMVLSSLYADKLDISTTSGNISGGVQSSTIGISSTSGDISLSSTGSVEQVKMQTISGDVWFSLDDSSVLQAIGVSTTSGDVSLGLPFDMGFTLKYATVSGSLDSSGYEMAQQNGSFIYNGGGCGINVETVSGDLELY